MPDFDPIAQALMDWFSAHKRDLPWRKTYDPYHVWISEVMLQQTQMERGVAYFQRWMERFPDIAALAGADEESVLKAWEGLGYYSRARNLHRAARLIQTEHGGRVPDDIETLRSLPGVGPYTAAAIASIAHEQDTRVVDANVERVMSRLFDISAPVKSREAKKIIESACDRLLPRGQARIFNQAVMEFGALVCTPRTPSCDRCPIARWCQAARLGVQEERPVTPKPPAPIYLSMATGVLVHERRLFVQKRNPDDVWGNLWEFPGGVVEDGESPAATVVREYLEETQLRVDRPEPIAAFKHSYTRYRVTMHAFFVELRSNPDAVTLHAAQEYRWAEWPEIRDLAFPAGHRKLIAALDADSSFKSRILP